MKRLALVLVVFLLSFISVSAQEWVGIDNVSPTKIQKYLVSSSEEEIVVDLKVAGFLQER